MYVYYEFGYFRVLTLLFLLNECKYCINCIFIIINSFFSSIFSKSNIGPICTVTLSPINQWFNLFICVVGIFHQLSKLSNFAFQSLKFYLQSVVAQISVFNCSNDRLYNSFGSESYIPLISWLRQNWRWTGGRTFRMNFKELLESSES